MAHGARDLGEYLVQIGLIDAAKLDAAHDGSQDSGKRIARWLIDEGVVTEERIVAAVSERMGIDTVDPPRTPIHDNVKKLIPRDLVRRHHVIPIARRRDGDADSLFVATADPFDGEALHDLQERLPEGVEVRWLLAGEHEIDEGMEHHYGIIASGGLLSVPLARPDSAANHRRREGGRKSKQPAPLPQRPMSVGGGTEIDDRSPDDTDVQPAPLIVDEDESLHPPKVVIPDKAAKGKSNGARVRAPSRDISERSAGSKPPPRVDTDSATIRDTRGKPSGAYSSVPKPSVQEVQDGPNSLGRALSSPSGVRGGSDSIPVPLILPKKTWKEKLEERFSDGFTAIFLEGPVGRWGSRVWYEVRRSPLPVQIGLGVAALLVFISGFLAITLRPDDGESVQADLGAKAAAAKSVDQAPAASTEDQKAGGPQTPSPSPVVPVGAAPSPSPGPASSGARDDRIEIFPAVFDELAPDGFAFVSEAGTPLRDKASAVAPAVLKLKLGRLVRRSGEVEGYALVVVPPKGPAGFVSPDALADRIPVEILAKEVVFEGCASGRKRPVDDCLYGAKEQQDRCKTRCVELETSNETLRERCVRVCELAAQRCMKGCKTKAKRRRRRR